MNTETLSERIRATERDVHEIRAAGDARDGVIANLTSEMVNNTLITRRVESAVEANRVLASEAVKELSDSVAGLLDFFNSVKGAFKVLNALGKLAKPLSYIIGLGTAITAMWYTVRHGGGPK